MSLDKYHWSDLENIYAFSQSALRIVCHKALSLIGEHNICHELMFVFCEKICRLLFDWKISQMRGNGAIDRGDQLGRRYCDKHLNKKQLRYRVV